MQTDVTVVVPTHNRLPLLQTTIATILDQRDVSFDIVVVNDGSVDGTAQWLNKISAENPRVHAVHHAQPRRLPGARNTGIASARGRWVAFCDDDDLWSPDKLKAQLQALSATSARWACTAAIIVDEKLRIIGHHHVKGGDIFRDLLVANAVPSGGSTVVVERSLINELGGFDETLTSSEDWDMWIRLARHSPVAAVDRPLTAYRQAIGAMSADVARMRSSRLQVLGRYQEFATALGVSRNDASFERFLAKQLLRAGSRTGAAAIFTDLVVKHGKWEEAPRIAAALLAPRLTNRIGSARAAAAVPPDWWNEAEAWLQGVTSKTCSAREGVVDVPSRAA